MSVILFLFKEEKIMLEVKGCVLGFTVDKVGFDEIEFCRSGYLCFFKFIVFFLVIGGYDIDCFF